MNNLLTMKGHVKAVLRDELGEIKQVRESDNLIVTQGRDSLIEQLEASPTAGKPTHMGLGTSTAAVAAGQTNLTAATGARVAFSSKTASANVLTMIATFGAGVATGTIEEAGIFSESTVQAGSAALPMYARALTGTIVKAAGDSLEITWTFTLTVP